MSRDGLSPEKVSAYKGGFAAIPLVTVKRENKRLIKIRSEQTMEILNSGSFITLDGREKIEQLIFTAKELAKAAS